MKEDFQVEAPQINKKKISFKWLIVSTFAGLIIAVLFFFIGDFHENMAAFRKIDLKWLLYAFLCLTTYWILEALGIFIIARISGIKYLFRHAFETNLMGQFYNSVTPFATGGQPMQIYRMHQYGVPISKATAIAMSKLLIYQTAILIIGVFLLVFFFKHIRKLPSFSVLIVVGFLMNFAIMFLIIILSFNQRLTTRFFGFLLRITSRFKFGQKIKQKEEDWLDKIQEFHSTMKLLNASPVKLLLALIVTIAHMFFYFSIAYCVYRMFQAPVVSFAEIFSFQGILFIVTGFVPIPGAGAAAEGGFFLFFRNFFSPTTIAGAVIMWRIMTYYMNIFLGAPFAIRKPKKKPYINVLDV